MKKAVVSLVFVFSFLGSIAQNSTQTVKGQVLDNDAKFPLIGVGVALYQDTIWMGSAVTDIEGIYRIENIEPGRYNLEFEFMGYNTVQIPQVMVNSAKQTVVDISMSESVMELEGVVVSASDKSGSLNKVAVASVRMFDAKETERYPGSRNDPARMAANFAGVQGADDSRNDIVVRGNSPLGVLYRVDGIPIPNPNHFAIAGSQGGPVSMLNSKSLGNSDFFTGAFPAEFGNSLAGVFDINFRPGNQEKGEYSAQFGLWGAELSAEGPIKKENRSSYILNYRYSTLFFFDALGLDLGTNAIPYYQDVNFKLNFPKKDGSYFSVFGIAGKSDIDIVISNQTDTSEMNLYGNNDRDEYFGTKMGTIGMSYGKPINEKSYFSTRLALTGENQHSYNEFVDRHVDGNGEFVVDSIYDNLAYDFSQSKLINNTSYTHKLNKRNTFKMGLVSEFHNYNFLDSLKNQVAQTWHYRFNYQGTAFLTQAYAQWKHHFSEKLTLNLGYHAQYYSQGNALSAAEPRMGLKWNLNKKQSLSLAGGLHSQVQPTYTYFYRDSCNGCEVGEKQMINNDMDFSKSWHGVLAYDYSISRTLRVKAEAYYQNLYNIPVEIASSSFSMINQGAEFRRFYPTELENSGTGENYGVEFTLEKFFSKKFFFLLTMSRYESKFKGSDAVERNTSFNGNYAVNFLTGKEFKVGEKSTIGLGMKVTWAGGKRYGIVDTLASNSKSEIVFMDDQFNEFQFSDYFRTDCKISYKINDQKVTHEIAIDLLNLSGQKNLLNLTYTPGVVGTPFRENYQLGFLPMFYYRLDF